MKPSILTSLFGTALVIWSCNSSSSTSPTTTTEPQPGSLQLVQGLGKSSTSVTSYGSYSYVFNLDTAIGSMQDEFILQNTGDYDITNINLTTNNPQFYFTPSNIPILHSSKTSLVVQVIKLNVIHGSKLDGIGYDSVLAMGNNTATAQISATTTDIHHDTLNIVQTAQLKVFAKLFDVTISRGDSSSSLTPFNLFNPNGGLVQCGGYSGMPFIETYSTMIKFYNSGNVPFKIGWIAATYGLITDSYTILPDSSITTALDNNMTIEIDGSGTISNQFKTPLAPNGRTYLCLERQGSFPL